MGFLDVRHADVGWLRRAAAELGIRQRPGVTISHKIAPGTWRLQDLPTGANAQGSVLESPLLSYRPQEGTPNMMLVDVGVAKTIDATGPSTIQFDRHQLQVGDLVRVTDAINEQQFLSGIITKAVRAGTVGVVESAEGSDTPVVRFTGYFDHPLGLPMVKERADGDMWKRRRLQHGPVQRILPTGELAGPETGILLTEGTTQGLAASAPSSRSARDVDVELARDAPALEVPLGSLERSDGTAWQPLCGETAARRQAMGSMQMASLPFLRRVSEARRSGAMPLLGFGHGESFLQPGGETSMAHDAPVLAYDGSGTGREFNLLYIDEEAQCAVVGMGSASGALYSSTISMRMLPLADVTVPFAKLFSPSMPLGRLLDGTLGEAINELYREGGSSHGKPSDRPYFKYNGAPLPTGQPDSLLASLRALFTRDDTVSAQLSTGRAWERLRSELLERRRGDAEALRRDILATGAIQLPLDLFCVSVGGRDLPVYLDLTEERERPEA